MAPRLRATMPSTTIRVICVVALTFTAMRVSISDESMLSNSWKYNADGYDTPTLFTCQHHQHEPTSRVRKHNQRKDSMHQHAHQNANVQAVQLRFDASIQFGVSAGKICLDPAGLHRWCFLLHGLFSLDQPLGTSAGMNSKPSVTVHMLAGSCLQPGLHQRNG